MPAYVYPAQSTHHRQRTYSQSYYPTTATAPQVVYTSSHRSHHSSPGHGHHHSASYSQPGAYYPTPQYVAPSYQYDSGRHHHSGHGHHRTGSGGTYYTTAPVQYTSTSRRSPPRSSHHTSTAHTHRSSRSQSLPRQSAPVRSTDYAYNTGHRLRRSESRPRDTSTHNVSRQRHGSMSNEPLGERIRRMFGFGGQSSGRSHRADYVDTRSGRTVDWRGRPIYRV